MISVSFEKIVVRAQKKYFQIWNFATYFLYFFSYNNQAKVSKLSFAIFHNPFDT